MSLRENGEKQCVRQHEGVLYAATPTWWHIGQHNVSAKVVSRNAPYVCIMSSTSLKNIST